MAGADQEQQERWEAGKFPLTVDKACFVLQTGWHLHGYRKGGERARTKTWCIYAFTGTTSVIGGTGA